MAENRTVKSCYESAYGGGWITAAQRLAELSCEHKAKMSGETLISTFWQVPPWNKYFLQQINHANRLLKKYDMSAIINAWRHPQAKRVYSLGAPHFIPIIEGEQRKIDLHRKNIENAKVLEIQDTKEAPRPQRKEGRSLKEKLERLNGKKENVGSGGREEGKR